MSLSIIVRVPRDAQHQCTSKSHMCVEISTWDADDVTSRFRLLDLVTKARSRTHSVLHFPEKSGIYHFLINFSSGMGEWYMKVVFEVLILFSLLSLISFT